MMQAHEPGPQISAAGDNRGRFCRAEIRGHAGKRNRVEPLRDLRVIGNGRSLRRAAEALAAAHGHHSRASQAIGPNAPAHWRAASNTTLTPTSRAIGALRWPPAPSPYLSPEHGPRRAPARTGGQEGLGARVYSVGRRVRPETLVVMNLPVLYDRAVNPLLSLPYGWSAKKGGKLADGQRMQSGENATIRIVASLFHQSGHIGHRHVAFPFQLDHAIPL
ncbi:hypothetical protein SAMN05216236_101236 [Sedimentitalea nanhaiensis]|uniref:Uncharacterized protein n=1 Tax=Sedimentitalea nanhaiensis TaxID=999627 RepID=A0A1I6XEW9_9RHOB|nr:hypothetical protein SAMN05216236_101236 [Sedimentitalea nanhaiensis]